jgi:hypothetical protein
MTTPTEPRKGTRRSGGPAAEPQRESGRIAEVAGQEAAKLSQDGKDSVTGYMHDICRAAETSCDVLKGQGHQYSADVIDRITADLNEVVSRLEQKTGGEIARELQSLAHRRPALFFGGALLAGFGFSRFLKSTEEGAGTGAARPAQRVETQVTDR